MYDNYCFVINVYQFIFYLFQALVSLLDFDLMKDEEENLEIIAALQSSEEGRRQYEELCCKREEFANMVCLDEFIYIFFYILIFL